MLNLANHWEQNNYGESQEDPRSLVINPNNFREHPELQEQIWLEYVQKVGFIGRVIANRRNRRLIDGEFRTLMYIKHNQPTIPVQWVDLDEAMEVEALKHYDQFGELAVVNQLKLQVLNMQFPTLAPLSANLMMQIPTLRTYGEQLAERAAGYPGDEETAEEEEDALGDFDKLLEGLSGKGGKNYTPGGSAKPRAPKLVLGGDHLHTFRQLLADMGKTGEVGKARVVIVIMADR